MVTFSAMEGKGKFYFVLRMRTNSFMNYIVVTFVYFRRLVISSLPLISIDQTNFVPAPHVEIRKTFKKYQKTRSPY